MKRYLFLMLFLVASLSGCGSDSASYLVDDNRDNAFSLFREKAYPGADWELALVLTHLPDCQRRYPLKRAGSDEPYKAELFLDAEGYYLLRSAKTWYEVQLNTCTLQEIKQAVSPSEASVGTWTERDGIFKFFPAAK